MVFIESLLASVTNLFTRYPIPLSSPNSLVCLALVAGCLYYLLRRNTTVYLLDFVCYKAPDHLRAPIPSFIEHYERSNLFDQESIEFLTKVYERAGIGSETCMPVGMHHLPPDTRWDSSIIEVKDVIFTIVEDILARNKISPDDIDIIVINCGAIAPLPSLSAMVINKFGFRSNVKSFNLSGLGCSAGLLSVSLVKDLLKVHENSLALIVSLETITPHGYTGRVKSMLMANTLFRSGGAAVLLSNRRQDRSKSRYILQHIVRTNMSFDDSSYGCISLEPDEQGIQGVLISRDILKVAANALRTNMQKLGPLVLPYSEQFRYGWSSICRKFLARSTRPKGVYVPDYKKVFNHFCIHAGGRAVIDAVEDNLCLTAEDVEPSRMTLYRFGNTSSSSVWYSLCYMEAKGRVKKGERIWQVSLGSGFKCNSAVWKRISESGLDTENAWSDRIHLYPVEVPELVDH